MKCLHVQKILPCIGVCLLAGLMPPCAGAQTTETGILNPDSTAQTPGRPAEDKRVLGVLPNYRTASGAVPFEPISAHDKFMIATKDSFDYPVLGTTAFFAGLSQLEGNDNKIYGQGMTGFGYRLGISYADQVVGNFFPEAIIPALTHTDPRYFRKGEGSITGRLFYAMSRVVVCKADSGRTTICLPELLGNITAATVTRAYHPHERTVGDTAEQFGSFIETDLVGDIIREFWPDIKRKMFHRGSAPGVQSGE